MDQARVDASEFFLVFFFSLVKVQYQLDNGISFINTQFGKCGLLQTTASFGTEYEPPRFAMSGQSRATNQKSYSWHPP